MKNRSRFILILGLLSAIGPFSIDMYLPGFPVIAASLRTTPEMVSYSLSSYFIGICVGQMLLGPLLDRYGSKRPLYGGLIIYILSSIGSAFAPSIEMLIALRFFQAAGGCVGIVAPRAIIRDVFPVEENAKIFFVAHFNSWRVADHRSDCGRIHYNAFWLAQHIYHTRYYCSAHFTCGDILSP